MFILVFLIKSNTLCCFSSIIISHFWMLALWYYCCPWPESNNAFQALAPVWSLTSSLQSTSLALYLSFPRRDPVGRKQDWHTSLASAGLRIREPSRWSVPVLEMESAVKSGVRDVVLSLQNHSIPVESNYMHVSTPFWQLECNNHVFLSSRRWTSSGLRWQLWRSALCVSLCLQGEDLPLLYLWWTQWWTALVFHLIWLWKRPDIFFLHREKWWADESSSLGCCLVNMHILV